MTKFIEKMKDFFSGKFVYTPKKKPAQPSYKKEAKPQQEGSKTKEKAEKQKQL